MAMDGKKYHQIKIKKDYMRDLRIQADINKIRTKPLHVLDHHDINTKENHRYASQQFKTVTLTYETNKRNKKKKYHLLLYLLYI